jgi:hypothetical protein
MFLFLSENVEIKHSRKENNWKDMIIQERKRTWLDILF